VAIKFNDDVSKYFQTKKGLGQGDPLSHILFIIVDDMLPVMIERAKVDGQTVKVIPHLVGNGLSILRYTYDTLLFMEQDFGKKTKVNMENIRATFGSENKFHKSKLFCSGEAKETASQYVNLLG
jgi:hypothetical protein